MRGVYFTYEKSHIKFLRKMFDYRYTLRYIFMDLHHYSVLEYISWFKTSPHPSILRYVVNIMITLIFYVTILGCRSLFDVHFLKKGKEGIIIKKIPGYQFLPSWICP